MATVIDKLILELGLDPSQFTKAQKEAANALTKTKNEAVKSGKEIEAAGQKAADAIDRLARNVVKLYALFTAGRGLKEFVSDIGLADAAIGRLARSIGQAPSDISALAAAVKRSGGSFDAAASSFQTFSDHIQEIKATGNSSILPFLYRLQAAGGKQINLNKDINTTFEDLADNLKAVHDKGGAAQANWYGRQLGLDPGTVALMVQGSAAYRKAVEESRRLGAATKKDTDAAESLQKSWTALREASDGLGRSIMTAVTPAIAALLDPLKEWVAANREWIATKVNEYVEAFGKWFAEHKDDIIAALRGFAAGLAAVGHLVQPLAQGFRQLVEWITDKKGIGPAFEALGTILGGALLFRLVKIFGLLKGINALVLAPWLMAALGFAVGETADARNSDMAGRAFRGQKSKTETVADEIHRLREQGEDIGGGIRRHKGALGILRRSWLGRKFGGTALGKTLGFGDRDGGEPNIRRGRRGGSAGQFGEADTAGTPGTYRPARQLTARDLSDEVVNTIAGEARLKSAGGADAVINNMFNRLGSKGWGPSGDLQDVARAPGQYEGYRKATASEAEYIRGRIRAIASGGVPDNTNGSNAFRASYYRGPWQRKYFGTGVNVAGNVYNYEPWAPNGPYAPYAKPRIMDYGSGDSPRERNAAGAGAGVGPQKISAEGDEWLDRLHGGKVASARDPKLLAAQKKFLKRGDLRGWMRYLDQQGYKLGTGENEIVPGALRNSFSGRQIQNYLDGQYGAGELGRGTGATPDENDIDWSKVKKERRASLFGGGANALAAARLTAVAPSIHAGSRSNNTTNDNSSQANFHGGITVNTAATDASGIARDMQDAIRRRSFAAAANYGQA